MTSLQKFHKDHNFDTFRVGAHAQHMVLQCINEQQIRSSI